MVLCSCVTETTPLSENGRVVPEPSESDLTCLVDQKNSDGMIKQLLLLLNWVIIKYHDLLHAEHFDK